MCSRKLKKNESGGKVFFFDTLILMIVSIVTIQGDFTFIYQMYEHLITFSNSFFCELWKTVPTRVTLHVRMSITCKRYDENKRTNQPG